MKVFFSFLILFGTCPTAEAFSVEVNDASRSNPSVNPETRSPISGVQYSHVLDGLHQLYPPTELEERNALSRKDGYWPYIREGRDPPSSNTYGEFDFYFFAQLLDRAHAIYQAYQDVSTTTTPSSSSSSSSPSSPNMPDWNDKVFVDIGSGTGRLVVAAAALHPSWKACRGIELLPSIHGSAVEALGRCGSSSSSSSVGMTLSLPVGSSSSSSQPLALPMAPVELVCGSFDDPYARLGDADLIFMFSSCAGPDLLSQLSRAIGRECKPGTLVITTDYKLDLQGTVDDDDENGLSRPFQMDLVDEVDGWCWCTGGQTTAHFHRVV